MRNQIAQTYSISARVAASHFMEGENQGQRVMRVASRRSLNEKKLAYFKSFSKEYGCYEHSSFDSQYLRSKLFFFHLIFIHSVDKFSLWNHFWFRQLLKWNRCYFWNVSNHSLQQRIYSPRIHSVVMHWLWLLLGNKLISLSCNE